MFLFEASSFTMIHLNQTKRHFPCLLSQSRLNPRSPSSRTYSQLSLIAPRQVALVRDQSNKRSSIKLSKPLCNSGAQKEDPENLEIHLLPPGKKLWFRAARLSVDFAEFLCWDYSAGRIALHNLEPAIFDLRHLFVSEVVSKFIDVEA